MAHELRKMTIDNHVTLPFDVTMTLVLMEDLYEDTSALHDHNAATVTCIVYTTVYYNTPRHMHRCQL